jgi:putative hydrolase of the HAD superfamily
MSRYILAVCFDSGDTIIDEATEIKNEAGVTQSVDLIPGAAEMLRELNRRGYKLALVSDGPGGKENNSLWHHGLWDLFDVHAMSGDVGVSKPDPGIFQYVLDHLDIPKESYGRVMMVGNHLTRDVKGANQLGLMSVWIDWSPRRSKIPADALEVPNYTIKAPEELIPLIERLESENML